MPDCDVIAVRRQTPRRKSPSHRHVRIFRELGQLKRTGVSDLPYSRQLTTADISEIRRLWHPPDIVRQMLEVVYLVLRAASHPLDALQEPRWDEVLRTLTDDKLFKKMTEIDVEALRAHVGLSEYLGRRYLWPEHAGSQALTIERVRLGSKAVVALFGWTASALDKAYVPMPVSQDEILWHVWEHEDAIQRVYLYGTCPGGHGLAPLDTRIESSCTVCGVTSSATEQLHGCSGCAWSICLDCRRGARTEAYFVDWGIATAVPVWVKWVQKGESPLADLSDCEDGGLLAWWSQGSTGYESSPQSARLNLRVGGYQQTSAVGRPPAALLQSEPVSGQRGPGRRRRKRPETIVGIFCWANGRVAVSSDEEGEQQLGYRSYSDFEY